MARSFVLSDVEQLSHTRAPSNHLPDRKVLTSRATRVDLNEEQPTDKGDAQLQATHRSTHDVESTPRRGPAQHARAAGSLRHFPLGAKRKIRGHPTGARIETKFPAHALVPDFRACRIWVRRDSCGAAQTAAPRTPSTTNTLIL